VNRIGQRRPVGDTCCRFGHPTAPVRHSTALAFFLRRADSRIECAAAADFLRRPRCAHRPGRPVLVLSKIAGLPVLALLPLLVLPDARAGPADLCGGCLADVFGVASLVPLYHGLAAGAAVVVAPVTPANGALVPLLAGVATADVPVRAVPGAGAPSSPARSSAPPRPNGYAVLPPPRRCGMHGAHGGIGRAEAALSAGRSAEAVQARASVPATKQEMANAGQGMRAGGGSGSAGSCDRATAVPAPASSGSYTYTFTFNGDRPRSARKRSDP
jgi:hypothetical protein